MRESIVSRIFKELSETTLYYKGMRVNMLGLPVGSRYSKRSYTNAISKLTREGLIENDGEFVRVTPKGKKYWQRRQGMLTIFQSPKNKNNIKNLLVMFDIPEEKKGEREWFRFHLKKFGYVMIQRSVWVGPSPLPRDFLDYLKDIKLKSCIKTFKLASGYKE